MFRYVAVDANSKITKGQMKASDKAEVVQKLRSMGLAPTAIRDTGAKEMAPNSIWEKDFHFTNIYKMKIKRKKMYQLINQLAMMTKAGVSLIFAIEVLIDGERDKTTKKILQEIAVDLQSGMQLSSSMKRFEAFSLVIINIVAAGELNGHLDTAFERIALMLDKEMTLVGRVKSAMTYPAFLMVITIVVVIILNVVVLPAFTKIFLQFNGKLPMLTLMVMGISKYLTNNWCFILAGIILLVIGFMLLSKKSIGFSYHRDRLLLKAPLFGRLLKKNYISRFARVLSSLLFAGVEIISTLESAQRVIPNRYMQFLISQIIGQVKMGLPISDAMKKFPFFDTLVVSMTRVGEETGMLWESMDQMAVLYEAQTDEETKELTVLIEPVMTIMIALVVGTIILSVVIPMFQMYTVVGGSGI
jgi:type IV pilus assembly protein PilC